MTTSQNDWKTACVSSLTVSMFSFLQLVSLSTSPCLEYNILQWPPFLSVLFASHFLYALFHGTSSFMFVSPLLANIKPMWCNCYLCICMSHCIHRGLAIKLCSFSSPCHIPAHSVTLPLLKQHSIVADNTRERPPQFCVSLFCLHGTLTCLSFIDNQVDKDQSLISWEAYVDDPSPAQLSQHCCCQWEREEQENVSSANILPNWAKQQLR